MNSDERTHTILVATDLSETGDHALSEALRLARRFPGSELHVVHVVMTGKDARKGHKLDALAGDLPARLEQLRENVARVGTGIGGADAFTQAAVFHVRLGEPAAAIHQCAVDVDADWIVVGTHGRRGVEKLILGSVAEELVRTARVPVLVARPKDFTGLARSPRPEAPRPGEDLHGGGLSLRGHVEFRPRTSHISGLL